MCCAAIQAKEALTSAGNKVVFLDFYIYSWGHTAVPKSSLE